MRHRRGRSTIVIVIKVFSIMVSLTMIRVYMVIVTLLLYIITSMSVYT